MHHAFAPDIYIWLEIRLSVGFLIRVWNKEVKALAVDSMHINDDVTYGTTCM